MALKRAFIGVGANLGDPLSQVQSAVHLLRSNPDFSRVTVSPWYRSKAVGPGEQEDYINGVVRVDTPLEPEQLLDALQGIEQAHGRQRAVRWGPRTLDLDLLLYAGDVINTERLTVPHPCLHERNFVTFPLMDLEPELVLPSGHAVSALCATLGRHGLDRLASE
jgi:2-amino-4-hydroxy-6-hydroxymethyldihydropteridine diphosphokinase